MDENIAAKTAQDMATLREWISERHRGPALTFLDKSIRALYEENPYSPSFKLLMLNVLSKHIIEDDRTVDYEAAYALACELEGQDLDVDPGSLAIIFHHARDCQRALPHIRAVLHKSPSDEHFKFMLAYNLYKSGDAHEGLSLFVSLIEHYLKDMIVSFENETKEMVAALGQSEPLSFEGK